MADLRNYFGAVMLAVVGVMFVSALFSQSLTNGSESNSVNKMNWTYTDTGQFPIAAQSDIYLSKVNNTSMSLTNSMNSTFNQPQNTELAGGLYISTQVAGSSISLIWDSFWLSFNMLSTLALSPIANTLGVSTVIVGVGLAYIAGMIFLIVIGIVLKWFV